jgi:hypothetical protein
MKELEFSKPLLDGDYVALHEINEANEGNWALRLKDPSDARGRAPRRFNTPTTSPGWRIMPPPGSLP